MCLFIEYGKKNAKQPRVVSHHNYYLNIQKNYRQIN